MLLNLTLLSTYSRQTHTLHHHLNSDTMKLRYFQTATLGTHATSPPKKATGPPPSSLIFLWQVSKMESLGWPVVGSSTTAVVVMVAWLWCGEPSSDRNTPSVSIARVSLRNWQPAIRTVNGAQHTHTLYVRSAQTLKSPRSGIWAQHTQ